MIGVVCLLALLVTAHRHPRPRTEALVAVAAVALTLVTGYLGLHAAGDAIRPLAPVVGFLVAILVVSEVCARAGLFAAAAELVRRRSRHSPQRLFGGVFVLAALVTTVLSLDATVVLLTPVVIGAARGLGASGRPGAYACLRLANSGSLLLPVANLTNLLALPYLSLTFGGFAVRMALPLVATLVVEYVGLRLLFAGELRAPATPATPAATPVAAADGRGWRLPAAVVTVMLIAFGALSPFGVDPWVPAAIAAAILLGWGVRRGILSPADAVRAANPSFALWVLALGVVVAGLSADFLGDLVGRLLPDGTGFADLLLIAVIGTLASALLANLSATLLIVPVLAPLGDTAVLAALLGLTIGAGLTWTGSLANLLWRRTLARDGITPGNGRFHLVSLTLTPVALVAAVAALTLT
ncbi:ArsB/NhaD family transporter [Nocardioides sp. BP30]|uniref:SLC13 family permease n=1 Tax=Nocardioides sp. BP30 TaxID=3036374 RepID=UPI00246899EB|nr:SLC13 family permease [Nocardioides sp. BP30]WGL53408.1 ArsB/NhaD family transporter [Nocardioides sp. BP30]